MVSLLPKDGDPFAGANIDTWIVDGSYFFYAPNKGAAIFFAIAFLTSGCTHAWQNWWAFIFFDPLLLLTIITLTTHAWQRHYHCWMLTVLFPICCLLFTVGFALREYGAFHYDNLPVYIASICITYASP